jgi:hypothetical protein
MRLYVPLSILSGSLPSAPWSLCLHISTLFMSFCDLVVGMNFVLYAMMGTHQTTTTLCSHLPMFCGDIACCVLTLAFM